MFKNKFVLELRIQKDVKTCKKWLNSGLKLILNT